MQDQYEINEKLLAIQGYVLHNTPLDDDCALKQIIEHWDGATIRTILGRTIYETGVQSYWNCWLKSVSVEMEVQTEKELVQVRDQETQKEKKPLRLSST